MEHFERIKVAAVITTTMVGISMIIDMLSPLRIADFTFSPVFVVPSFVILYMLAPIIGKYIKYK